MATRTDVSRTGTFQWKRESDNTWDPVANPHVAGSGTTTVVETPAPPGGGGGTDSFYVHHQSVLSTLWDVQHNLGRHPSVSVEDGGGSTIYGTIKYVDDSRLTVGFKAPATGRANCT